ncbi:TIGR03936 family radical SAM-associated protein [Sediminispirochaeta smaragdinae]|uniref:Radical SAM domain protein n=1 Tax=Sediminispirochaeta smaragdinae (strain DSM 11293 / JCM 15392 / SEBR 4228) TaxID=573413 RepID=E1R306_SEDSS|nr:TIGR03936 family radical SAM-associated protein [Sediminispirochaeta smaragdinae]ADK81192.1 Radical SAM domain protein [Sediminispirochaeta smaragdinae DSM 11293]
MKHSNLIIPEKDLRGILHQVLQPGRYVGGEYGMIRKELAGLYRVGICFPDLYEIGMSNNAVKILYGSLNALEHVACERVFAPAFDFEEELLVHSIPLFTLENGIPLNRLDLLGISIGYELSATTILHVLHAGGVALHSKERREGDPIVIAGGPAVTNPTPFGAFFDGVFIGEAESVFSNLVSQLADAKKQGADRDSLISLLRASKHIWYPEKSEMTIRASWQGFGTASLGPVPVPNIKVVQDHGVVEIMRGCPNGCRFCHAGYFYRQKREKPLEHILEEVEFLVRCAGYREITLSSLSSGDYSHIHQLITLLNQRYASDGVSFSLPSLKVNSFTLPLLQEISRVRKSGLTFAIEVPGDNAQKTINKSVPIEQVIDILRTAKQSGWRLAKFYFMIGLPIGNAENEVDLIGDYIEEIQQSVRMPINVNVGTFIPKPHTPFQWSRQLHEEEASEKLQRLKGRFRRGPVKLNYHDPFISTLEGVLSRGDARVGALIEQAFKRGAGLDAWEEHVKRDLWRDLFANSGWNITKEILEEKSLDESLPWDSIDLGVGKGFLKREKKQAKEAVLTSICSVPCDHNCGICVSDVSIVETEASVTGPEPQNSSIKERSIENESQLTLLCRFSKTGKASFLSHINTMTIFERSFQRAQIRLAFSQGFNPKPKLSFANPLMLGVESNAEYLMVNILLDSDDEKKEREDGFLGLVRKLNNVLPDGFAVSMCSEVYAPPAGEKKVSLMAAYGGSVYTIEAERNDRLNLLYDYLKAALPSGSSVNWEKESLRLYLADTGRKDGNLRYYMEGFSQEAKNFFPEFIVTRTATLTRKRNDKGRGGGSPESELISYEQFFSAFPS